MDLNSTKNLVQKILTEDLGSRNSDNVLYVNVCKNINLGATSRPFYDVMNNPHKYGLPAFETVSRARRKLQEENEELRADTRTQEKRDEYEQMFFDFFGGDKK